MMSDVIFSSLFALVIAVHPVAPSNNCQKFFVTSSDGYVNVRSSPQVKINNTLATLPSGTAVQISQRHQAWLKINSPLVGWLSGNQTSRISCYAGRDLLINLGWPTISKLGKKSQLRDKKAAETLVKMSPYVDGASEEVYAGIIAEWANQNPNFLVSILDQQNPAIRQSVLLSLDFGLGVADSPKRQKFESFLQRLHPPNPTVRDWQKRNPVYPKFGVP
jgi:hypothetical protein